MYRNLKVNECMQDIFITLLVPTLMWKITMAHPLKMAYDPHLWVLLLLCNLLLLNMGENLYITQQYHPPFWWNMLFCSYGNKYSICCGLMYQYLHGEIKSLVICQEISCFYPPISICFLNQIRKTNGMINLCLDLDLIERLFSLLASAASWV